MDDRDSTRVILADISEVQTSTTVRKPIKIGAGREETISFLVIPKLPCKLVLGMPWLHQYNPVIDWKTFKLTFVSGTTMQGVPTTEKNVRPALQTVSAKQVVREFSKAGGI